jgi:hypothetical protein
MLRKVGANCVLKTAPILQPAKFRRAVGGSYPRYHSVAKKTVPLASGLTQTEVTLKLKKPQPYVSKIERGERRIDVVELKQLLKLCKKSCTDFIG